MLNFFKRKTCFGCQKTYRKKGGLIRITSKDVTAEEPYHEKPICPDCVKLMEKMKPSG